MDYKVIKSGGEAGERRIDFTVIFNNTNLNEADVASLNKNATSLFGSTSITESIDRQVHLFIKNGTTVALIHYVKDRNHDSEFDEFKKCEKNCEQVIEHLSGLLGVYAGGA